MDTMNEYISNKLVEYFSNYNEGHVKEFKVIETNPDDQPTKVYVRVKTSSVSFSERDFVAKIERQREEGVRDLYVISSDKHPDYPVNDKTVRMDIYQATMISQKEDSLSLLEFS